MDPAGLIECNDDLSRELSHPLFQFCPQGGGRKMGVGEGERTGEEGWGERKDERGGAKGEGEKAGGGGEGEGISGRKKGGVGE
jgi:hypothetical protein